MTVQTFDCPNHLWMRSCQEKYGWEIKPCSYCIGGTVTVDSEAIAKTMIVKGKFRRSRPKAHGFDAKPGNAVYGAAYVWRMIRFHSGQDMSMPMLVGMYIGGTGNKELMERLDALTDLIGEAIFGKLGMLRATAGWGRALIGGPDSDRIYSIVSNTVGMPMGDGYDIGDHDASPEAFIERNTDENGELDLSELTEVP